MNKALVAVASLVLLASGLFALFLLFVGVKFGGALWDPSNPRPTILWLAAIAAPLPIVIAFVRRGTSPLILALSAVPACLIDAVWIIANSNQ